MTVGALGRHDPELCPRRHVDGRSLEAERVLHPDEDVVVPDHAYSLSIETRVMPTKSNAAAIPRNVHMAVAQLRFLMTAAAITTLAATRHTRARIRNDTVVMYGLMASSPSDDRDRLDR